MYDHIKIHKCLHYYMKLVHAVVHNRVIFYMLLFFINKFSGELIVPLLFFSMICLLLHFSATRTATNFSFYSYLLIIILTMITQKRSMDCVSCPLHSWHWSSEYKLAGRATIQLDMVCDVVRSYVYVSLHIKLWMYTMQVLIDNAFCRQFQRQSTQYIVLLLTRCCCGCYSVRESLLFFSLSHLALSFYPSAHARMQRSTECWTVILLLLVLAEPRPIQNQNRTKEDNKDK